MKFRVLIVIVLVTIAGPVFAQQIHIDYDKDYDLSGITTFTWAETSKTSVAEANPLLHSRILNGIEYYLTLAGTREVESDPDVYVTYHASTRDQVVVNTTNWGYGYPRGWGYYGGRSYHSGVPSTTTVNTYKRGTLVVDVWDAETKQLVWRGVASNISVYEDPVKMKKRIDKALKKMAKKWEKIKKKNRAKAQD